MVDSLAFFNLTGKLYLLNILGHKTSEVFKLNSPRTRFAETSEVSPLF